MAEKSIEKELMHLETQYWEAIKTKDFEKALSMTDDPCLVVGPRGVDSADREKFRSMMKSQTHSLRNFELKNAQVHPLTEDVAVLAYNIREDLLVDGKPLTIDAIHSSTWIRRRGRWTCALHTASIPGDPFGRDRQAAA